MLRTCRNRGTALIYAMVAMVLFCAMVSIAVDLGRAQVAKTELQRAADASARAAASALGNQANVATLAVQIAAANKCDGTPIALDPNLDLEFGDWDSTTRTFTPCSVSARDQADAVRVTCRRTTSRQNPIRLAFAFGRTCDISATAVAALAPEGYGLIGLNSIKLSGNASASYWSGSGSTGNYGNIASNGNISSSGSSRINGNVFVPAGKTVSGVTVGGSVKTLTQPLSYPSKGDGPAGAPDFKLSGSQTQTLPGGDYYVNNVSTSGSTVLTFTGPATVYYYGTFNMTGKTVTSGNLPKNLTIVALNKPDGKPPGKLTVGGSASLYASIYAPDADIDLSGTGNIYGSVLGKTINMSGSSDIYYDLGLPNGGSIILEK